MLTVGISAPLSKSFDETQISDTLASYEFYGTQKRQLLEKEELLWYEVLELAIDDYKTSFLDGLKEFRDVFDWFFNTTNHVGSFQYICDILDINGNAILSTLIKWTKFNYRKENPPYKRKLEM